MAIQALAILSETSSLEPSRRARKYWRSMRTSSATRRTMKPKYMKANSTKGTMAAAVFGTSRMRLYLVA